MKQSLSEEQRFELFQTLSLLYETDQDSRNDTLLSAIGAFQPNDPTHWAAIEASSLADISNGKNLKYSIYMIRCMANQRPPDHLVRVYTIVLESMVRHKIEPS
jgi:hypothetical protein